MEHREPLLLMGAPGSPYTRKMLAMLRYRRIPYALLTPPLAAQRNLPIPKVPLLPTFYLPGETGALEAVTDSSPLIRCFERMFQGRGVVPPNPAAAFLDMLVEDYADEWLTKPMFHYRWSYAPDIERSARTLPLYRGTARSDEEVAKLGQAFRERQIGRLGFVGSNVVTGPIIEASYLRLVDVLNTHLTRHMFVMGGRPGASDFAIYGQLTQLAGFDPTPMALTLARAPRIYAWVQTVDDLSGLEPHEEDWLDPSDLPATLTMLLAEVGRTYVPVMLANEAAVSRGLDTVVTEVDGARWEQQPFPYQAKCIRWIREAHRALDPAARRVVERALGGTGCERLVS